MGCALVRVCVCACAREGGGQLLHVSARLCLTICTSQEDVQLRIQRLYSIQSRVSCVKGAPIPCTGTLHGHCIYAAFLRSARVGAGHGGGSSSLDATHQKAEFDLVMILRALAVGAICNKLEDEPEYAFHLCRPEQGDKQDHFAQLRAQLSAEVSSDEQ